MIELVQAELLVELGDAAAGIDQLLLASEEGVTLRAHFYLDILLGRTCLKLQEKFLILSVLFSSLALFPNFIVNFLTLVMQFLFTSAVFSRIMALTRLAHG